MKIHEIMTVHTRCVPPDQPVAEAATLMRDLNVGSLPVCENDRLAGIVTDRDIAIRAVAPGRDFKATSVGDVMSPGIVYVFDDDDVTTAAHVMEKYQIRRLPVLNRAKRLVGIVSLGDISVRASAELSGEALKEVCEPTASSRDMYVHPM